MITKDDLKHIATLVSYVVWIFFFNAIATPASASLSHVSACMLTATAPDATPKISYSLGNFQLRYQEQHLGVLFNQN